MISFLSLKHEVTFTCLLFLQLTYWLQKHNQVQCSNSVRSFYSITSSQSDFHWCLSFHFTLSEIWSAIFQNNSLLAYTKAAQTLVVIFFNENNLHCGSGHSTSHGNPCVHRIFSRIAYLLTINPSWKMLATSHGRDFPFFQKCWFY